MSGGQRGYMNIDSLLEDMERDFRGRLTLGVETPKSYEGLDKKYWSNRAEVHKPPRWFWRLGKIYAEMLHDIDWDVSGDETLPKKYREKKLKKIKSFLPE